MDHNPQIETIIFSSVYNILGPCLHSVIQGKYQRVEECKELEQVTIKGNNFCISN